jgi:hypothetical protein
MISYDFISFKCLETIKIQENEIDTMVTEMACPRKRKNWLNISIINKIITVK